MISITDLLNVLYPIHKLTHTQGRANIQCPNPAHHDRHPSAHIYGNRIWCFACCQFFKVEDLIQFYHLNRDMLYEELIKLYAGQDIEQLYQQAALNMPCHHFIKRQKGQSFIDFTNCYFYMDQ